jgi:hypothetical protein
VVRLLGGSVARLFGRPAARWLGCSTLRLAFPLEAS